MQIKLALKNSDFLDIQPIEVIMNSMINKKALHRFLRNFKNLIDYSLPILLMTCFSVKNKLIRKITIIGVLICVLFNIIGTFCNYILHRTRHLHLHHIIVDLPSYILALIVAKNILFNEQPTSGIIGASMLFMYFRLVWILGFFFQPVIQNIDNILFLFRYRIFESRDISVYQ